MHRMGWRFFNAAILFFSLSAVLAFDGDGQIDILPNGSETFSITESGSYVLTDNVTMTADVTCIEVNANNVTIDLNGHVITGFGSSSNGIYGGTYNKTRVFDGVIRDFGSTGVFLGDECSLENITVSGCGSMGVRISDNSKAVSVTATGNHDNGISADNNCVVLNCISKNNGGFGKTINGIRVGNSSTVQGCLSSNNKSGITDKNVIIYGIYAGFGCTILDNVSSNNTNYTTYDGGACIGINARKRSVIRNNVCQGSSGSNKGTVVYGIKASDGCVIVNNTSSGNYASGDDGSMTGIACGKSCLVKDNVCSENFSSEDKSYGIYSDSYSRIIGNTCFDNEGSGHSIGIYADGGGLRIENNHCSNHADGTVSFGIMLRDPTNKTLVIRNTCLSNDYGISMGNGGHYCAENITDDAIVNTTGVTMGTGDRSNVTY